MSSTADSNIMKRGGPSAKLAAIAQRGVKGLNRRWLIFRYSLGRQVECSYCGWTGSQFLPRGKSRRPNRLCPRCGSIERYRKLHLYLTRHTDVLLRPVSLLEIAPRRCFRDFCNSQRNVRYLSSDLRGGGAMVISDLTSMGIASESFDIIVCMHVLEHISDDRAALAEVQRLLKPTGFAIVVIPMHGAETFEDPNTPPEDRERVYGQSDHVRIYGMDVAERMKQTGLKVEILDMFQIFDADTLNRFALYGHDRYFFRLSKTTQ